MDKIVDFVFSFKSDENEEEEEEGDSKSGLGYGSPNFIKTIALAFFGLILVFIVLGFVLLIRKCITKHKRCLFVLKLVTMIKHKLMFNAIIRSFL